MAHPKQRSEVLVRSEADLAKDVRQLVSARFHLSFIESHATSAGVPDVAYTVEGVTGWVELKFCSEARSAHMRNSQIIWIKDNINAGGCPLVLSAFLARDRNEFGLIRGESAVTKLTGKKNYATWLGSCGVVTSDLNEVITWLKNPSRVPII